MEKKLKVSSTDRRLAGVCGGIAEYFEIDPTIVRLCTAVLCIITLPVGLLAYAASAFIMS